MAPYTTNMVALDKLLGHKRCGKRLTGRLEFPPIKGGTLHIRCGKNVVADTGGMGDLVGDVSPKGDNHVSLATGWIDVTFKHPIKWQRVIASYEFDPETQDSGTRMSIFWNPRHRYMHRERMLRNSLAAQLEYLDQEIARCK